MYDLANSASVGPMRVFRLSVVFIWVMIGSVISACAQQEIPKDLVISLTRHECMVGCPTYSLVVSANGYMKFTPLGEFEYVGRGKGPSIPIEDNVGVDRVAELLNFFQKVKFYTLLDKYDGVFGESNPSCPEYFADAPSVDIAIEANGKRKSIHHYTGCLFNRVTDDLTSLEKKIDEAARVSRWLYLYRWRGDIRPSPDR